MDKIRKTLITVSLVLISASAHAAGLGKLTVFSALGQPFRAEIELVSVTKEESLTLSARLAPPEAFRQANIDYSSSLLGIKFKVEKIRPDSDPTALVLRLSSASGINEPFLDMLVELNWAGGRLVREYTTLLDPPGYSSNAPAPTAVPVPTLPAAAPPVVSAPQVQAPVEARPLAPEPEVKPEVMTESPAPAVEAKPAETKPVAPAEPRTSTPSKAAAKPAAGSYEVKRGDTLRKIAEQNRADGVSVDQMLMALYRNNHSAFIGNNMNRMRSGVILNIPDRDTALETGEGDARRLVTAQAADFNAYRRQLAGAVAQTPAAKEPTAVQSAKGKITPQVEDKAAAAKPGQDTLKLSKADDSAKGAATGKADDKAAKSNAVKEAESRAAALDKIKQAQQKLLELKNQEAAALAAKAAEKKAADEKAIADKKAAADEKAAAAQKAVADKKAAADQKVADQKAAAEQKSADAAKAAADQKAAADKAVADQKAADAAKAAAVTPAASTPVTPPATTPATTPAADAKAADAKAADTKAADAKPAAKAPKKAAPPPPEPSLMDQAMEYWYAIVGLLVVIIGAVVFALRRRKNISKFEDSIITGGDLKANSVFANTGGQSVDTGGSSLQSIVSESGEGGSDSDEVDPIAEADVYMAYGRDSQAEEILKEALAKDPSRQAIRAKLLEIYFARKDARTFETIAGELYAATGGSGPEWTKAAEQGAQLDPTNSLYSGQGSGGSSGSRPAARPAPSSPEDTVILPGQIPGQMPTDTVVMAHKAHVEAPVEEAAPEEIIDLSAPVDEPAQSAPEAGSSDLDFDLDLGDGAAKAADFPLEAAPADAPADSGGLDFDIGGGDVAPSVESSTIQFSAPSAATLTAAGESEFDSTSTVAMAEGTGTPPELALPSSSDAPPSLDLDIGGPSDTPLLMDEEGNEDHERTIVVDFNMPLDVPGGDHAANGNGAGGGVQDARWQEVATKLDLAKAYEEMGDKDGTRELLNEVLKEGDMGQQDQARSILTRLG